MILAVDVGNSNIVIGGVRGNDILFETRIVTDAAKSSDEYAFELKTILAEKVREVEGAIISSVVPQVVDPVKTALKHLWGVEALVVGPGMKHGMTIKIDNPHEVGQDLIVGCAAALREHKAPIIVIDMGTANTMFALDADGAFIGGCIAPGVKLSMDALTNGTALLPDLELSQPEKAIGTNTVDCMRSGVLMGTACMLDGMVQRMEEELGAKATVVATGGIARFIIPMCRTPMIYDKDLLLKGLVHLYRENAKA